MFYKDERVALFIDGAELHTASRKLDVQIDFHKFRAEFVKRSKLLAAYYFVAVGNRSEYEGRFKLYDWLAYNGFRFESKSAKERIDDDGRRTLKTNMDVELTVTALELAPRLDHAVIVSGNEELVPLVVRLKRLGVRVSILSTMKTEPRLVSDELRREADNFIELKDLIEDVGQNRD